MRILAIDPGPEKSGWCVYSTKTGRVLHSGVDDNETVISHVQRRAVLLNEPCEAFAIEMIASYGMAVGKDVFETCVWVGRFVQAWEWARYRWGGTLPARRIYRRDVKLHLCNSARAKDTNVRQALIDKLGPPGTKKQQGPTYGVKSHAWAALAIAVTAAETQP